MGYILDVFKGYEVEYDVRYKILTINKPIQINDFMYLKLLVSLASEEVKDIRVYGTRYSRIRGI